MPPGGSTNDPPCPIFCESPLMLSSRLLYLLIDPAKFHILKFILEGYDNLAIISSVDARQGVVKLRYTEDMADELFALLAAIAPSVKS